LEFFEPINQLDCRRFTPDGASAPSIPASNLLTLHQDSLRAAQVMREGMPVCGTDDYYIELAQTIVGYANEDPDECVRFLARVFLPSSERMGLKRHEKLIASS
jgi:hypothetical protein